MERGFKAWSERASLQYRKTLGIAASDPLPVFEFADSLGVQVWDAADVPGVSADDLKQLLETDGRCWSAVTIARGGHHLVLYNSSHTPARTNNNIAHELAHIILEHKPGHAQVSEDEILLVNSYRKEQEEEADWLAGALLAPRDALWALRNLADSEIAQRLGISEDLARMRVNRTGVRYQKRRSTRRSA